MLKKLQAKWKVNGWKLFLVICTFAIGGSLCGFLGRKILVATNLEKNVLWFLIYIVLITILWPLCVLVISIPLGQFAFFKTYLNRIRLRMMNTKPGSKGKKEVTRIAIFASGAGSNAGKILEHFKNDPDVKVALVVSNKATSGAIELAKHHEVDYLLIGHQLPLDSEKLISLLQEKKIDLLVLAGFLLKIPASLVKAFPKKIINIHPALLPRYGGKGMYGVHVHAAVIANREKQSGITIHYVDEIYDNGEIIFQANCDVAPADDAESLAVKIHLLEHAYYPSIIKGLIKKQKTS